MIDPDYDYFCKLVHDRSGLVLTPEKIYLVNGRLDPVARTEGFPGVPDLLKAIRAGVSETLIQRCVDAMATHESYFFRDGAPFELLASTVLPRLIAARQATRSLRIWCAACSSGQEPYSAAMILQEMGAALSGWRLEILATDMSEPILKKAREGIYSDFEVQRGLSPERLARWFTRHEAAWQVSPVLRQMVRFKPHNLLSGAAGLGVFDAILCRNVLIYFDVEGKRRVMDQLSNALAPDGSLLLGSAETVLGVTRAFEPTPGVRGLFHRAPAATSKVA